MASAPRAQDWPALPFAEWKDTCATLHLWTQIVGKIRLARAPMINHWWQVTLYVTPRGLTTSSMPYGSRSFQLDFDFIDHRLRIDTSDGSTEAVTLAPCSVAEFYGEVMGRMAALGLEVSISTLPSEIPDAIPFDTDTRPGTYDPDQASRFWRILAGANRVFTEFRSGFIGKASPVHFFWGGFDLAVTRFSGRRAPPHPPVPNVGLSVVREAYSHEVSSCGFWPGNGGFGRPAFYAYGYPEPPGLAEARVRPGAASYNADLGEFLLPYDDARHAPAPDEAILEFLQSTYEATAELGGWDRAALERAPAR